MIELLLAFLFAALPGNFPDSPIVSAQQCGDAIATVHADGAAALIGEISPGVLGCAVADDPQPQQPSAPIPTLTASWKDVTGTTHTVTTPITSTTPAGLRAAIALHQQLVQQFQSLYPPVPNP